MFERGITRNSIVTSGLTLFDVSGRIAHGFSDSIIESIVDNSSNVFTISDLMKYGCISSLRIAIVVLEVLNGIFEDIQIDNSFYELAVLSSPVYHTVIDAASEYSEPYLDSELTSDIDC